MPRPKSLIIVLLALFMFALVPASAGDQCEKSSKSICKFPGPPISFNYYGDMYFFEKQRNGDNIIKVGHGLKFGTEPFFSFQFSRKPADGKTAEGALEDEIKSSLEISKTLELSIDGPIANVQRTIGGQLLHGKLLRIDNETVELYTHKYCNQIFTLKFSTMPKGHTQQAKRYYKIIADSIQWQSPNQPPSSELLKFPGSPISFEYSSDMDLDVSLFHRVLLYYPGNDAMIRFESSFISREAKTPKEALDSEIISKMQSHMEFGHRLVGNIEDVERSIRGKLLKGKLLRISWGSDKSGKKGVVSQEEIYIYKKGEKFVSLKFTTNFESRGKAECYFKIIADSIH